MDPSALTPDASRKDRKTEKQGRPRRKPRLDHQASLLQLVELETIDRERRSAERRLKAAKFPCYKTLDEFDYAAAKAINKLLVLELMRGDSLVARENILLVGDKRIFYKRQFFRSFQAGAGGLSDGT